MELINDLVNKIKNTDDINEKVSLIKELNINIEKEELNLNNILNNNLDEINNKLKIPIKYKKMSIDELEDLFENTNDLNEKIIIYQAINRFYNNVIDDLFEN
jgi:hypothetical protein